jgi:hypothetical protein
MLLMLGISLLSALAIVPRAASSPMSQEQPLHDPSDHVLAPCATVHVIAK